MDPFFQLYTQSSGSSVAPETLEMLGRQASQMFQSRGVPLNDAITQVVSKHPEIGNEHIQRIIEFANTVTFQEMFQNSSDKNVHFDVADPGVILRDLKDGGSPAHDGKPLSGLNDYNKMPQGPKSSEIDQAFNSQFMGNQDQSGSGDNVKLASLSSDHERHANPIDDAFDAYQRLTVARDKLASSYETMDGILKQAHADLYSEVRAQILDPDGAGLGGVAAVMEKVADSDLIESLLAPMTRQFLNEGISAPVLNDSLRKTAGIVVNMEHPILAITDSIIKVASEMINCSQAIDDLDIMIGQTKALFKRAGALTTKVKETIGHKGLVPAGIRQRFPAVS